MAPMQCVLVTGAGASRDLGKNGPLPLMEDWAAALRTELNSIEPELAEAIGLKPGMSGEGFEHALGEFLRWNEMWPLSAKFRALRGESLSAVSAEVHETFKREGVRLQSVLAAVNKTLFRLFSAAEIDEGRAIDAYGNLLEILGNPADLMVVTTNYDPAAEIALGGLGRLPNTGFDRLPGRPPTLNPAGLAARARSSGTEVGVLHLHGAVGWYENSGIVHERLQDQPFDANHGRPVVLYPDPAKDPTRDALVRAIWAEFDAALEDATHVVVLGHSLHDPALVAKLRIAAQSAYVAICVLGVENEDATKERLVAKQREVDRILREIPGKSTILPIRFGPRSSSAFESIRAWLAQTTS